MLQYWQQEPARKKERKFNRQKESQMFKNRFFNILVAVALLAVLMLTVQEAVATKAVVSEVESTSRLFYAANPELMVAARYSAESDAPSESAQLEANPELSIARRYSENISSANASFANNPELSVANRYAASQGQINESIFLSQNPELSVARRYADMKAGK